MRSIPVEKLNQSNFFRLIMNVLFQNLTLVVVLKQSTAGTNRRSYAIHHDEWEVSAVSESTIRFQQCHTSDYIVFWSEGELTLSNNPDFYLESITCVDSRMNPQLIYTAGSNKILVGNKVDVPFELQNTN